jgi:GNAT superfamily N-acetyltransferase
MTVDVRPMTDADRPAVIRLLGEISRKSEAGGARTLEFIDKVALVHLVAVVNGEVVGRSNVARPPMLPDGTVALNVGVTAGARRQGVGAALFDGTAREIPRGTDRILGFSDDRDDDAVLPWLAARHFVPFQHSIASELDLTGWRATVPLPADVTVRVVDPQSTRDDEAVARLYVESDTSPEADEIGATTWSSQLDAAAVSGKRGRLVLLDVAGEPVAMSLGQQDSDTDWDVFYTGVHPGARGRGLARVAKAALHDDLAQLGATRLETYNEAGNAGIRHVNASLGYVRVKGARRHRRDLAVHPLT